MGWADMDDTWYQRLKWLVLALATAWIAWAVYDRWPGDRDGTQMMLDAAHKMFADGEYAKALNEFQAILQRQPEQTYALRGEARSLMQLGQTEAALRAYDRAILAEPDFAAAHANRAILLDRSGRHQEALDGYQRALALDPSIDEGPGWLTRFLRNQSRPQARISERAAYLRRQLSLPPEQRLLRLPAQDAAQRAYQR